jgi:crotonobetainyl-CoA:carnitine CoA-transferase CaiB-like acyl-CoA transferase
MVAGGTIAPRSRGASSFRALDDERFHTNPDRVRNREALVDCLRHYVSEARARWRGSPPQAFMAPVADVGDAVAAEQTQALGLQAVEHCRSRPPSLRCRLFDGERASHSSAPAVASTEEVLRELVTRTTRSTTAASGVARAV